MNKDSINPFASCGTPVDGKFFVGREQEIKLIQDRLFGDNFGNVSIVGIPKIGKSSLMQQVLMYNSKELWENNRFIISWFTFKGFDSSKKENRLAIFDRLVRDVYHFLVKHDLRNIIDDVQEYYDILKEPNLIWSEFEQNILYFFEEIAYDGCRIIYCIDEFDYSKECLGETEYQLLRELSYRNSNKIAIVTTSRRSIYDIEHYSGGGSNFYGTFECVYLKPFSKTEHILQCQLISNINLELINELYVQMGGHPFLNALILNRYFSTGNFEEAVSQKNQDILQYYNDLFYVLSKDNLSDKVDMLYCGFYDGVSAEQEDYIYNRYGIFVEDDNERMIPYSESFSMVLRKRYRENPFNLLWPQTEQALRKAISYALTEEYGDDDYSMWVQEIFDFENVPADRFNIWVEQMEKEKKKYGMRASLNIIDQLYPWDYILFFEKYWKDYLEEIFGYNLYNWKQKLSFIASVIRNPYAHSRLNLLTPEQQKKASFICQEILDCVKSFGL